MRQPGARSNMKMRILFIFVMLMGCRLFAADAAADASPPGTHAGAIFEWSDPQDHYDHVMAFRLWIPPDLPKARAVVVLTPGSKGDGRPMANDPAFQALAEHTGAVLCACYMKGEQNGRYDDPAYWSGPVLLRALQDLAVSSHHPEIADAPLAFWGHSAGGQFNYNFTCWKPERVIAFIANKGAYYTARTSDQLFLVPGLWFVGGKDQDERIQNITNLFVAGRRRGAPWCLAVEPNIGHDVGRSKDAGIAYLEAVIPLRLGKAGVASGLLPVPADAWVGELTQHEIRPHDPHKDAGRITSWLPDEGFAKIWCSVVTGEPVP